MADTKISLLTELTDPVAGDSLPIVDASTSSTKKVTVATLDGRYIVEADVAAKGDIYVATANDTVGVLTVGANDQVLTADSATATGVKWATPTAYQPLDADLTTIAAANNGSVLAATTASFTTADESKLDGIEAAADVTDATNVSAAGASMVSSGAGAPASTPSKVGNIYIDTTSDNAYIAVGTASSADWEISNDGAGSGSTDLSWVAATSTVASSTGTDAILTAVDGSNPGLMSVADKSKLDGIEALADVTDATNVAAAGALMDSEVTNLAAVKAFDPADYATAAQGTLATNAVPKATFPDSVSVALSDMTTQITTGTTKAYWVNPFDAVLTVTKVKATLATAGTGATVVDINEGAGVGTSILSTKITIDASETDSDDATTPPVISDTSIAADGRLTFDIDTAGTSAAGLMVHIMFTRPV